MFCKESHNNHLDHYDGWFKYSLAARGAFEEILQQYAHMASFKTVLSHISTSNFRKPTWNECSIIHCSLGLVCTINMFCFCLKKKLTYWLSQVLAANNSYSQYIGRKKTRIFSNINIFQMNSYSPSSATFIFFVTSNWWEWMISTSFFPRQDKSSSLTHLRC